MFRYSCIHVNPHSPPPGWVLCFRAVWVHSLNTIFSTGRLFPLLASFSIHFHILLHFLFSWDKEALGSWIHDYNDWLTLHHWGTGWREQLKKLQQLCPMDEIVLVADFCPIAFGDHPSAQPIYPDCVLDLGFGPLALGEQSYSGRVMDGMAQ